MMLGVERLLADKELRAPLEGKRVALVAHPASVTRDLTHSLVDVLLEEPERLHTVDSGELREDID